MTSRSLLRYPGDVARAFAHAPLEVGYAALVAFAFSLVMESGADAAFVTWWELVLVVLLAGSAAWSATLRHALGEWSARRRWVVSVAGAAAAIAYGRLFLDMTREADVWRAATLVAAALLLVVAAPGLGRDDGDEALLRFRRLGGRLLLRVVGAGLYAGALFVGLALAIAAVDGLFELGMQEEIYGHVFGWIAFAVAPWIVVGGLPELTRPLAEPSGTAALFQRVAAWLILPLLVLYYAILYAYAVRIVALGELPSNLVSPLVGAAAVLGVGALFLFDRGPADTFGGRALRAVPALFLPLAALGLYAVFLRVGQYGWTEFRHLRVWALVALAGLAVGAVVPVLRRRPYPVHLVPAVLGVVLALAVIGPWGAPAVARESQHARLVAGLEAAGLLGDDGVAAPAPAGSVEVSPELHDQIGGASRFLVRHFGPDAASPPLPSGLLEEEDRVARDVPAALGLRRVGPRGMRWARSGSLGDGRAVPAGDVVVLPVRWPGPRGADAAGVTRVDSVTWVVTTGTGMVRADLGPVVGWLARQDEGPPAGIPPEVAAVPLLAPDGTVRGHLVVTALRIGGEQEELVTWFEGVAVLERDAGEPDLR